MIMGRPLLAA